MTRRWLTAISLLVGGTLFALVIRRAGAWELYARVAEAGWAGLWILLIAGTRPALRSLAWLRSMAPEDRRVGFWRVWRARVIGDAVGNLMTAGPLLAEPARLVYLGGGIPMQAAAASLSIELLTYVVSCVVVMAGGLVLLLARFAIDARLRAASLAALALLLIGFATALWVLLRRWSPLPWLERALTEIVAPALGRGERGARLVAALGRLLARLARIEREVFEFYRARPRDFLFLCGCEAAFHAAGVGEIWVTLRLIGERAALDATFIFEAVNRLITVSFAFIPARMGVDEAGTGLLAAALGFPALVGVAVAVYRKLRVIFWTAVGLALLAVQLRQRGTDA